MLNVEDYAAALSAIKRRGMANLLLRKYSGHADLSIEQIQRLMLVRWTPAMKVYKKLTPDRLQKLVWMVIDDQLTPRPCPACKGTRFQVRQRKGLFLPVACNTCNGTGVRMRSVRTKAAAVQVNKVTWNARRYEQLYQRMSESLRAWERVAVKQIRRVIG